MGRFLQAGGRGTVVDRRRKGARATQRRRASYLLRDLASSLLRPRAASPLRGGFVARARFEKRPKAKPGAQVPSWRPPSQWKDREEVDLRVAVLALVRVAGIYAPGDQ